MTAVLLVDDQELVRAGLRMLCRSAPDLSVAGEAATGAAAVRLARETRPDVVLMDLHLPGMDGIEATRRILAADPGARVVVLTTFDDDDHLYPALEAGASGFLAKGCPPPRLLAAIRQAAGGESPFSPDVLRRLVARAVTTRPAAAADLTPRERELVHLVGTGLTNEQIAQATHLAVTTVKSYLANAMARTGARNRVQLAVYAVRHGLA
ncbi:response regulator [Nocardia sp. NPDC057227]|uniref:response regulator n=1 Tax=Nocardia sp. NPDC057227 TaxID=3346056 RepID=UPI00363416B7